MEELYVVSGANGYLGISVVESLLADNKKVRALVMPQDVPLHFDETRVEVIVGDIRQPETLTTLFAHEANQKVYVIHTAGLVNIRSHQYDALYKVNVLGTQNILAAARAANVTRLVYVSSVHALQEAPHGCCIREQTHFDVNQVLGDYAKTKVLATKLVLSSDLDVVVVHPSGLIGPNDYGKGNVNTLIERYLAGKLHLIPSGGYDFVDVRDVAKTLIRACTIGPSKACYILSNDYIEVKALIAMIAKESGTHHRVVQVSASLLKRIAPLMEWFAKVFHQAPLFTAYSMVVLQSNGHFSHDLASAVLDHQPRPFEETIKDLIAFTNRVRPYTQKKP